MLRTGIPKLTKWGLKQGHLQQQHQRAEGRERAVLRWRCSCACSSPASCAQQDLKGENLGWSFNGELMLTITLGESLNPSFFENSYESRVTFPNNGRSLTISQLGKKDAGTYTAKNSVYRANFTLRVHSVLREPEVTCVSRNCSADACRYVLRCAVNTPGTTSFSWSHGEQLDAEEAELVVEEEQPPPGELDVLSHTCTVRNPVSSRNVTVSPAAVCADTYSRSFTGIIAVTVIIAIIILAVLLAFLIFREVAAEYMTVYAEVGIAQQDFPCAQKNDRKKTPAPEVETSKTIYSTVQNMAQVDELGGSTLGC
ncbi:SLAM family member 9-like [Aythya fuligula]|uniref:SLAM family member 9-like n=1 Tax=Aythya fuligula TaxID=219594 RepID=A0A6J3EAG8_AYTFU|nr:SLAM family member 9-like [Aythya fuligula]